MSEEDVARKRQAEFAASVLLVRSNNILIQQVDSLLTIIHIAEKHNAPFNAAHLRAAALHMVDAVEQSALAVKDGDQEFSDHLLSHPEGRIALAQHNATMAEYRRMIEEDTIECEQDRDAG